MFKKKPSELIIPPAVLSDPRAVEMARIWAAHGEQHVSLNAGLWEDPAAWGIMLVDLARHVSNYYAQEHGHDPAKVMARIKDFLDAEWDHPGADVTGSVIN